MSRLDGQEPKHQTRPEDLHVVTENGEQCFMWRANQLTYIAQDRHELPLVLADKFGHLATKLDLSYNSLTRFKNINLFTNLNELILDNNELVDDQLDLRPNLRLKTLSLNKNKLVDLFKLINTIKVCYPNLEFLSLIGNPLCPGPNLAALANESQSSEWPTQATGERQDKILDDTTASLINGGIHGIDELILSNGNQDEDDSSNACLRKDLSLADFNQQKYRHFIIYHLPNLRFLDSSPISLSERNGALRRCFWMKRAAPTVVRSGSSGSGANFQSNHQIEVASQATVLNFSGGRLETNGEFCPPIIENYQQDLPKGVFSRLAYKYTGRNSEGNRFIRNNDL